MATTTTKAEVPTFSYAQAAKGLAAPTASQQPAKNTEQNAKTTEDIEASKASVPEQNSNSASAEASRESEKPEHITDPESKSITTGSSKNVVSGTSSPNYGTASTSTLAKDDEIPAMTNGVSDSQWDKQSQTSTLAEKSSNGKDNKKEDSAKSADKNAQKELKVAPPPAVNVWQQRKEAQEAKAKASAAILKSTNTTNTATKSAQPKQASASTADLPDPAKSTNKKKTANESQADASGPSGKDRKRTENGRARDDGKHMRCLM